MQIALGQMVEGTVVIALNGQNSDVISTNGLSLCGVILPAAFTGTALTLLGCLTLGGTYVPVVNIAGAASYTVAQGNYLVIDPLTVANIPFLKLVSNASEGAARTLTYILKGV